MDYGFVAYIDEAGDTGLNKVRPIDSAGATEWLCLGAVVIRAEAEAQVPRWLREIRDLVRSRQGPDLHFRSLRAGRKQTVCEEIAKLPVRCFVVASNKKNMRGYQNSRAAKMDSQQWFYNWCVRLLLERITDYCEHDCLKRQIPVRPVKVEFATRGGHRYSQTIAYQDLLRAQARNDNVLLSRRVPKWPMLHRTLFKHFPAGHRAGLQLADSIANAFYTAVDNLDTGPCEPAYAKAFHPCMAEECGSARDYGVALQPTPAWKAALSADQQEIFRFYGYDASEFVKRAVASGPRHRQ